MESGKSPEKLLLSRKRDLRLTRPERFGIWPESEFPLKLKTRSWSSWFKILASRVPLWFWYSTTSFVTLPFLHSLTPCHLHTLVPCCHGRKFKGSMADLRVNRASASPDLTGQRRETTVKYNNEKRKGYLETRGSILILELNVFFLKVDSKIEWRVNFFCSCFQKQLKDIKTSKNTESLMCLPCSSPSSKIFPKTQKAKITFKSCFWRFLIGNTTTQITFKTPNLQDLHITRRLELEKPSSSTKMRQEVVIFRWLH